MAPVPIRLRDRRVKPVSDGGAAARNHLASVGSTTEDMKEQPFEIAFLGLVERASQVADGGTNLLKWNLLGFKGHIVANFFPLNLGGMHLCFAIRGGPVESLQIRLLFDGKELGGVTLFQTQLFETAPAESGLPLTPVIKDRWTYVAVPIPSGPPSLILPGPGTCELSIKLADGMDLSIGGFPCYLVDPPPFTPERIAAMRSAPYAAKAVRVEFGCQHCPTKLRAYAGLEHLLNLESEGYIWFSELPDEFECSCKATRFDLSSVRRNLQAALDGCVTPSGDGDFLPLYSHDALITICRRFSAVLEKSPREEVIQTFMEENPILLHQFPSLRTLFKPNILTFFTADFAILTPQKELILVEIEKANTRLLKRDGGEAAGLTHAFDQVRHWLHVVDEHRLAVLATLRIPPEQVAIIKGLVIAGRDKGESAEHLRRLKGGANRARIEFLTFDDLVSSLALLAEKIGRV